ncbi:MAG: hypothetical protein ACD_39C02088G0002 [uncultured bacterium]|nr:MAG: hypothetical protein ACD_39C02088G0002 [uncultured bacterium]
MTKKYLPLCLIAALFVSNSLSAQTASPKKTPAKTSNPGSPANPTQNAAQPATTKASPAKPAPAKSAAVPTIQRTASGTVDTSKIDPIKLNNQMMMVFMERMKAGNYPEAREIANQMIFGHDSFKSTETKEYKSFHSMMEKELYLLLEGRQGRKPEVEWVEQPISDGFYLLSILDFQENKHEEALANMQRAVFWNPVRSAFYSERGFMLLRNSAGPNVLMAQVAYLKALELADNAEDFAAALRGLSFIFLERRMPDVALACLLVVKQIQPQDSEIEEELFFIRRNFPGLYESMDLAGARKTLSDNRILAGYSPDHVQVLIRLADSFKSPKDAPYAISLLHRAREMSPKNQEVARRLQVLEKK